MNFRQIIPLAMGLMALLCGCQESDVATAEAPTVQVHLPPSPTMEIPSVKERHPDGSYTVEGLILNGEKALNTAVRISGFIQRKYVCTPEQQACETPSHAVLVDDVSNPNRRLIVVGGDSTRFGSLTEGERVTLDAFYGLHDPKVHFVRTEGVLILPHIEEPKATASP